MRKMQKTIWLFLPLVTLLLLASLGMFAQAIRYDSSCAWSDGLLQSVVIEGMYSEEGGEWRQFSKDTEFDYRELRDITVRGHFTRDIPESEKLFLNICQLWVTMYVNGEEIFRFGPEAGDGNPAQSIGNMWATVTSPGITTADEVELSFGNLYRNAYFIQFDNLLWHMYTGSERVLVSEAVHKDAGLLIMGTIFLVLTLFLMITGILLASLRIRGAAQFFRLGVCTLFSAAWFATLAPALSLFIPFPVFLNTLYAVSIQGIAISIILFVTSGLSGWRKKSMFGVLGVLIAALLFAFGLQMTGVRDMFSSIDYFSMLDTVIALFLIFCLAYEIRVLKNQRHDTIIKAMLPLVVLGILEMLNGMIQWIEAGICFGLGLFLFALMEGFFILRRIRQSQENEKRTKTMETELVQGRISIMLSQIQPHFLYNALLGIKELCDTEPQKASVAMEHFSYFLRGNLDALSNADLIPFTKELEHVEDYLHLEKMRYEERIVLEWQIEYKNFMLPPLTLQPIIENAVRHGITKKNAGGKLTICTEQNEDNILITVRDDGAGFDINEPINDGKTHIGIENVRKRLEMMCGGTLIVRSEKGVGTEVTVILPQRRENPVENHSGR